MATFDELRMQQRVAPLMARDDRVGTAARAVGAGFGAPAGAGMASQQILTPVNPDFAAAQNRTMPGAIQQTAPNAFSGGRVTQADVAAMGDIGAPGGTFSTVGVSPQEQAQRSALASQINLQADAIRAGNLARSRRASDREQGALLQQSVDERQGLATQERIAQQEAATTAQESAMDRASRERIAAQRNQATLEAADISAGSRIAAAEAARQGGALQKKLGEERAKNIAEREAAVPATAATFRNMNTALNRMEGILNQGGSGLIDVAQGQLGRVLPISGLEDEATRMQRFQSDVVAPLMAAVQSLQGLGQVSNIEFSTVGAEAPSFSNTEEANRAIIANLRDRMRSDISLYANQRGQDLADMGLTEAQIQEQLLQELPIIGEI